MTLEITRTSPTTLRVSRFFAAPPARVYAAHTDPALIPKWLLGPDGWSMPECLSDARPGGSFRFVWRKDATGHSFYATGEYITVEAPHRMLHVERMFLPDQTPENMVETTFTPEGTGTRMIMTMSVPDAAAMDAMVATGMTDGMETSYVRLEESIR
ncbi:MAG: SRPBCC domain-containing protein [Rhodobacterales bacterium]|nr:SRPBCC domain-containing protein [Rhodobacterales bacterium]